MKRRFDPEKFEQLLVGRGLDYAELQRRTSLSSTTIRKAKAGKPVTMRTVRRIADAVDEARELQLVSEAIA